MSTLGAFTGGLAALWWLVGTSRKHRPGVRALLRKSMVSTAVPMGRLLARVVVYAIPISLGALVVPLFNQADVSTVTMSLVHQVGLSQDEAMAQFGILSGRAQKIIAIPATFATTVALTIIPLVSEAYAVRNYAGFRSSPLYLCAPRFSSLCPPGWDWPFWRVRPTSCCLGTMPAPPPLPFWPFPPFSAPSNRFPQVSYKGWG